MLKGLFANQLVLQTFTAHFSAVWGAIQVDSPGLLDSEDNYPQATLGLTAAAVCLLLFNHTN